MRVGVGVGGRVQHRDGAVLEQDCQKINVRHAFLSACACAHVRRRLAPIPCPRHHLVRLRQPCSGLLLSRSARRRSLPPPPIAFVFTRDRAHRLSPLDGASPWHSLWASPCHDGQPASWAFPQWPVPLPPLAAAPRDLPLQGHHPLCKRSAASYWLTVTRCGLEKGCPRSPPVGVYTRHDHHGVAQHRRRHTAQRAWRCRHCMTPQLLHHQAVFPSPSPPHPPPPPSLPPPCSHPPTGHTAG